MNQLDLAVLILRLAVGGTMVLHGVNKVKGGVFNAGAWFESMGMRPGRVHGPLAAATEIVGGSMVALGLLMPLASASMISVLLVAIWVAHRKVGFFIFRKGEGWEYCANLCVAFLVLGMVGARRWSLDNALGVTWNGWTGTAVAVVVGVVPAVALLAACYRSPQSSAK